MICNYSMKQWYIFFNDRIDRVINAVQADRDV